jgi:hypothetical protein
MGKWTRERLSPLIFGSYFSPTKNIHTLEVGNEDEFVGAHAYFTNASSLGSIHQTNLTIKTEIF